MVLLQGMAGGGGTGAAGHKARSEEARNQFVHWEAVRDIGRHVGSQWHAADTWHATDVWHATASQQPSTACNSSRQANAHGPAGRAHQEGAKGHKGSLLHANRYLACSRCLACDSGPAAKHSRQQQQTSAWASRYGTTTLERTGEPCGDDSGMHARVADAQSQPMHTKQCKGWRHLHICVQAHRHSRGICVGQGGVLVQVSASRDAALRDSCSASTGTS